MPIETKFKRALVRAIEDCWKSGDMLKVGVLVFERIPKALRPAWGADLLELASQHSLKVKEIESVIQFARTPTHWAGGSDDKSRKAHEFFGAVRDLTLIHDEENKDDVYGDILVLAENVAKVTYNAYDYAAPFDHEAGWWIPSLLKKIVDKIDDAEFSTRVWEALTNETYLELETPIRCNPFCSTCGWLIAFEISA
jgi:hypothetical protein